MCMTFKHVAQSSFFFANTYKHKTNILITQINVCENTSYIYIYSQSVVAKKSKAIRNAGLVRGFR